MSDQAGAGVTDELRELFATPPPDFVEARNALVKRLRAEKRRDEAALIAKIRRPNWVDWALNAVAAGDGELVEDFAGAAEVLREAQAASIEGRDGPDLRGALRALRDATTALGRRAGRALAEAGRDPDTAEVTSRLGEIAAQAGAVDQLRAGVLGSADPGDEDLFAGLTPAAPAKPRAKATEKQAKEKPSPKRASAKPDDTDKADRAEADVKPSAENRRRAEAEAKKTAEREKTAKAEQAARRVERARLDKAVATARKRAERAEERFRAAQRALDEARADLDEANEELDTATAELEQFDAANAS